MCEIECRLNENVISFAPPLRVSEIEIYIRVSGQAAATERSRNEFDSWFIATIAQLRHLQLQLFQIQVLHQASANSDSPQFYAVALDLCA